MIIFYLNKLNFLIRIFFGSSLLLLIVFRFTDEAQIEYFTTQATFLMVFSLCGLFTSAYFINKKLHCLRSVQNLINITSLIPIWVYFYLTDLTNVVLFGSTIFIASTRSLNDYYKTDKEFPIFVYATLASILISNITKITLILLNFDLALLIILLVFEEVIRQFIILIHYLIIEPTKKPVNRNLIRDVKVALAICHKNLSIFGSTYIASNKTRALIFISEYFFPEKILNVTYSVKLYELIIGLNSQVGLFIWAQARRLRSKEIEQYIKRSALIYRKISFIASTITTGIIALVLPEYVYLGYTSFILMFSALTPCLTQVLIKHNDYYIILKSELFFVILMIVTTLLMYALNIGGQNLVALTIILPTIATYYFILRQSSYGRYGC